MPIREELLHRVRVAAGARDARPYAGGSRFEHLVVIGASTGGPRALGHVVPELPVDGRTAYLIVQHMPAGFTRSLAERLDAASQLAVREAAAGDRLRPGTALVAPGDYHLRLTASGAVELDQSARVHGVRPSLDLALQSAAERFGRRTVAVILTGMGRDGADGAGAVRQAGGRVIAEDESTCVVWGMPRAVVERGLASQVVPLDGVAQAIASAILAPAVVAR
jgi:two-component system chemotaxis response regulator CheB